MPTLVSGPTPFASCPVGRGVLPNAEVEPWIAADPADRSNLIGVWQQDRDFLGGARGPVAAWSSDGGRTWTRSVPPRITTCTGGPYVLASDPVVSIGPDGRAYLASLAIPRDRRNGDVVVNTSGDLGRTWSPPVVVRTGNFVTGSPDKEYALADPRRAGVAYCVWVEFAKQNPGEPTVDVTRFSRTTDGGATWSPSVVSYEARTQTQFHQLAVLPDGTLLDAFAELLPRRGGPVRERLAVIRSIDGGSTWSPPSEAARFDFTNVEDPTGAARIRGDSLTFGVAAAPDGRVYLAWAEQPSTGPSSVLMVRSDDGGATWTAPRVVASEPRDAFLPAVAVSGDGRVGVLWNAFEPPRTDGVLRTDVWFASSSDLGRTWRTVEVAGPFDLHAARLTREGGFLGDYEGLAGLARGFGALFTVARPLAASGRTDQLFASLP